MSTGRRAPEPDTPREQLPSRVGDAAASPVPTLRLTPPPDGYGEGLPRTGALDADGRRPSEHRQSSHPPSASARRPHPVLLVVDDGAPAAYAALIWALREAARREGTVVAVAETSEPAASRQAELDGRVARAVAETGSPAPVRTAVLNATVLAALTAAACGADLVVVGARGKTLLRAAVPRTATRGVARGA